MQNCPGVAKLVGDDDDEGFSMECFFLTVGTKIWSKLIGCFGGKLPGRVAGFVFSSQVVLHEKVWKWSMGSPGITLTPLFMVSCHHGNLKVPTLRRNSLPSWGIINHLSSPNKAAYFLAQAAFAGWALHRFPWYQAQEQLVRLQQEHHRLVKNFKEKFQWAHGVWFDWVPRKKNRGSLDIVGVCFFRNERSKGAKFGESKKTSFVMQGLERWMSGKWEFLLFKLSFLHMDHIWITLRL